MLRRLLLLIGLGAFVVGIWAAVGNTGQPNGPVCPSPSPGPSPSPSPSPSGCPPAYPLDVSAPGGGNDAALPATTPASRSGMSGGELLVLVTMLVSPVNIAVVMWARRRFRPKIS